jgi:hypothetical protein
VCPYYNNIRLLKIVKCRAKARVATTPPSRTTL